MSIEFPLVTTFRARLASLLGRCLEQSSHTNQYTSPVACNGMSAVEYLLHYHISM